MSVVGEGWKVHRDEMEWEEDEEKYSAERVSVDVD